MIGSGGDSIGRILIVEFTERNGSAFDEVMQVLNQHSNFEQLQLKNMPMLSLPGLDIYPDRRKVYRNSNEINLTTKEFEIFYLLVINKGQVLTYDQIYHKVDRQAQERSHRLIEGMKQAQGITERLKEENALEWIGKI